MRTIWAGANEGYWPVLWFFGKMLVFIFMFIWLRGSLPRLRYDQFMAFGWKVLIPVSLAWTVLVATLRTVNLQGGVDRQYLLIGAGVMAALFVLLMFFGEGEDEDGADEDDPATRDAFAGGFPVPPMPRAAPSAVRRSRCGSTPAPPCARRSPRRHTTATATDEPTDDAQPDGRDTDG